MKLEEINVKSILALLVVAFGLSAIVFVHIEDMALGAIITFVGQVIGYFFGSSKGSEAKDKTISDMGKSAVMDAPADGDPIPPKGPKG